MPWIETRPGLPYFVTSEGKAWTPIGQNDAIDWPELAGLYRRRDVPGIRRHLQSLKDHGVTCLRLMLEYAQGRHRYLEQPAGKFVPNVVQWWDDMFALCEEIGLYILLTPFDTFFAWRQWQHHPYNLANGGPCADRRRWMLCDDTRLAIKRRLEFATRRWGASPALFAWDLWNEIHPAHGEDEPDACAPFITDLSQFLRALELELHGRAHPQTTSIFGPQLLEAPQLCEPIFRHRSLTFATTHLYEFGTIDDPKDTVAPALAVGRLMRAAILETDDFRPVFDSEHGPIHSFIDRHETLPEAFDDEYFRHMQWAHLASGGAGGGMRWPNRHPHMLTPGMREAQRTMAPFLPAIDWTSFRRRNLNEEAQVSKGFAACACGDEHQALAWLLRTDSIGADGRLRADALPARAELALPGLAPGHYRVQLFDTRSGRFLETQTQVHEGGNFKLRCDAVTDVAIAVRRLAAP